MPKIPRLSAREVIKILYKADFIKWRQKGGHLTMFRKSDERVLTVPVHYGKDISKGTLRVIINQAGMSVEEFLSYRK